MSEYKIDMRDVRFLLFDVLKADKLAELPGFDDPDLGQGRELYDMILDEAYKLARTKISPVNAVGDKEGVHLLPDNEVKMPDCFHGAYAALREGNWVAPSAPAEWGGIGLPEVIALATMEMFTGAAFAFMMTPGLSVGAANLIKEFGSDAMKAIYLEKMYSGQWAGTMHLTEENAGTDVGASRSKAFKQADGTYHIHGTKIFISSGEQPLTENIIHLVLARTEGAPKGTGGLSLFVVPKYHVNPDGSIGKRNGVKCSKLEEKLGIHGSPTSVMEFGGDDDTPAVGLILGEELAGMKQMFQMMNEARMYVGVQAFSSAASSYQEAVAYCQERLQGSHITQMKDPEAPRVPIIQHPDVRRMLTFGRAYTEAMRALVYHAAYFSDLAHHGADEKDRKRGKLLAEILTPICKAWCSDMSFKVAEQCVQACGGYGYISEYPFEQHLRDIKITSIYEGANGIQALDLGGRQIPGAGGMRFMTLLQWINEWVAANKDNTQLADMVKAVDKAKNKVGEVAFGFQANMKKNPMGILSVMLPFLHMFGDMMGAFMLAMEAIIANEKMQKMAEDKGIAGDEKAMKALAKDNPEFQYFWNKVQTADFYMAYILPNTEAYAKICTTANSANMKVVFE